jgi:uncharacterized protein (TIGR03435 family)
MRTALLLLIASAATAQNLTFDVVSVKPNRSGDYRTFSIQPIKSGVGKFTATNAPLRLVLLAYQVDDPYLTNAPSWLDSESFDVEAKVSV